jgi:hypothetical protein
VCQRRSQGRQAGQRSGERVISLIDSWSSRLDAGRSPSRAIASGARSGDRSDRVGLLCSACRPLAGCSSVVGHQLPARAAAIRDRESTRLAYALPNCVPSASRSSSLLVPLSGSCGRKRARTAARSIRLGRVHRARWGSALRSKAPGPQSKPVTRASRLVAHVAPSVAFGLGLRILAARPARASSNVRSQHHMTRDTELLRVDHA